MTPPKNDFIYILRGSSFNYLSKLFHGLIQLLFAICLGKLFGSEIAGLYFVCFAYFEFAKIVVCYATDHTARRFVSIINDTGNLLEILKKITTLLSIFIISIGIIFIFSPFIQFPLNFKINILFIILAIPFGALLIQQIGCFQGLKAIRIAIILENILPAIIRLTIMLSLFFLGAGEISIFIAFFCSFFIPFLYGKTKLNAYFSPIKKSYNGPDLKKIFAFSSPIVINQIVDQLVVSGVPILISFIASTEEVGLYGAATRVILPLNLLLLSISNIFSPIASQYIDSKNYKNLTKVHNKLTIICIIISAPAMWLYAFFPEFIIGFFGPEFIQGSNYVAILSIGVFIMANFGFLGEILMMAGKTREQLKFTFLGNIFGIILSLFLFNKTGPIAFAIGPVLGVITTRVFYLFQLKALNINVLSSKILILTVLTLSPLFLKLFDFNPSFLFIIYIMLVMILSLVFYKNRNQLLHMN